MSERANLLFVELLGGLGDVLIALPAIQALGRSHPSAQLTVLTFAPGGELLETDPLVNQVRIADRKAVRSSVAAVLADRPFDLIVSDTCYDGIDCLLQDSNAPTIVTNLWRSPPENQFVGERFLEILLQEGVIQPSAIQPPYLHLTDEERQYARNQLGTVSPPLVVLYPDAGMAIKRWSAANFIELGQQLHHRYSATVIVPIGADAEQATAIATAIGGNTRIWQRGSLRQLAALLSWVDLMVAADTGPARIAAAIGTPTVTLFGPSWQGRYGQPLPHINLQGYPACPERSIQNFTQQSCWYSGTCPLEPWDTCLQDISVEQMMTALTGILHPGRD